MALLRLHSCALNPFRVSVVARVSCVRDPFRVLRPFGPLHWTPTLALSISISFPSQYVSRWRPMQDRCFNIGSALTYNNYRSVEPPFRSTVLRSLSSRLASQPSCFGLLGGRLVGVSGENSRPLPHIDESGSLADQKLILFVQFNIDRTLRPAEPGRRRGDAPKEKQNSRALAKSFSLAIFIACWRTFTGASSRS